MKPVSIKPTKRHAQKIVELLKHGLTKGLGRPEPGKMCVEAAVCFAFGLGHSENPPWVGFAVREFKIKLNDCSWPSDHDRADGMKELAIAQLGSNEIDQMKFGKTMYLRGVQKILPFIWRKEAEQLKGDAKKEMLGHVAAMEAVKTFEEAEKVAKAAYAWASASASACAYASASACAYASAYACASAYASASASAYRHDLLKLTASLGVEVLEEMKSPGCKWLSLTK